MSINHWPKQERPRERLLQQGAHQLSTSELLAILLGHGTKGKSAVCLAHELLEKFKDLRQLFNASSIELCAISGIGIKKVALIKAAAELGRRIPLKNTDQLNTIKNPQETAHFIFHKLNHYTHEVFAVLFLDAKNRIIQFNELFHGSLREAAVYPREVVKLALSINAAHVILAHNHPSGDPTPSQSDIELTHHLQNALEMVDIYVLDHLIIGEKQWISFVKTGLL